MSRRIFVHSIPLYGWYRSMADVCRAQSSEVSLAPWIEPALWISGISLDILNDELRSILLLASIEYGEFVNDVVEGGSQVVDSVTNDDWQGARNGWPAIRERNFALVITDNPILATH